MIEIEERGELTILRLRHGKVNAIDVEFLTHIASVLDGMAQRQQALVLTGNGSMFSAGVDLVRLVDGGKDYVASFLPALDTVLRRLAFYPRPVVAAVDGHAIAGGCILACACDLRIMSAGNGRIGAPELLVGVPFPAAALEIMRFVLPAHQFQTLIYTGRTLPADDAQKAGLVDEVVERVVERACELAVRLAAIPAATFALSKRQVRRPLAEALDRTAELDREVTAKWCEAATLQTVQAYVAATLKKGK